MVEKRVPDGIGLVNMVKSQDAHEVRRLCTNCCRNKGGRMFKRISKLGLINTACIIAILYVVVVIVYAASFSVVGSDDISNAYKIGVYKAPFFYFIKCCLAYTKRTYLGWGGNYSSLFIMSFLSPMNNFGFTQQRLVMVLNALFFIIALGYFAWTIMKPLGKGLLHVKLFFLFIVLFCVFGFEVYPEAFFWFTGAACYTFPMSFVLLGLAAFVRIPNSKSVSPMVFAIILGPWSMGGCLMISALGCFVAVLYCIYFFISNHRIPRRCIIALITWFVFAGLNAFAPGNYLRYTSSAHSGVHLFRSLINTVDMSSTRWNHIFTNSCFVFLLIVLCLVGAELSKSISDTIDLKMTMIAGLIGLLTPWVASFPLAVGYDTSIIVPNRCMFIIDISIILSAMFASTVVGMYLPKCLNSNRLETVRLVMVALGIIVFMMDGFSLPNIKFRQISRELYEGEYQQYYYDCKQFLESLDNYEKGKDILIPDDKVPEPIDNSFAFVLPRDPEDYVNVYLAKTYGFKSIRRVYSD